MLRILILSLLGAACVYAAEAQSPVNKADDESEPNVLWTSVDRLVGPTDFGMVKLEATDKLYEVLTASGRCNTARPSNRKEPCAFISYAPSGSNEEAYVNTLRPVFRVISRDQIWSIVEGRLARVSIGKLAVVRDLIDPSNVGASENYPAVAVVGWAENAERCSLKLKCIGIGFYNHLVTEVGILSDGCVDEIWNRKSGPTGAGVQSRCRYSTDRDFGK